MTEAFLATLLFVLAAAGIATVWLRRGRSVRATPSERRRPLDGDDLIPDAVGSLTHAITIGRPPEAVWPWLVQMGGDRAGWYSYDVIDNARRPSATRILPDLQSIEVGMIVPALPGATDAFTVLRVDPHRTLVLGWVRAARAIAMTWAFVLEPAAGAHARLIVRARVGHAYQFHGVPAWAARGVLPPVHFVMQRKQLLGIAWRAERGA
ncbi:MAG: hypothetical protein OEW19_02995 [Acidobacteriota bacterium]|nr:hypothetical protein [Acidobacteriota bacterium]